MANILTIGGLHKLKTIKNFTTVSVFCFVFFFKCKLGSILVSNKPAFFNESIINGYQVVTKWYSVTSNQNSIFVTQLIVTQVSFVFLNMLLCQMTLNIICNTNINCKKSKNYPSKCFNFGSMAISIISSLWILSQ